MSYWDQDSRMCKVSLAGIHYPDTALFFGDEGILDATKLLADRGWLSESEIWMADHFRAAADMIVRWALSDSLHCNIEITEWFPADQDRQRFLDLLGDAEARFRDVGRLEKLERWLR